MRARRALCVIFATCAAGLAAKAADAAELRAVRGVRLYTQTFGSGAPILFLHGGLHHFDNTFADQRDTFAAYRRVIGVDQRGHGHSPDTAAPFSYREMADDTAALIRELGVGPVDVVGHSDGGNVALLLAASHPELVRRVAVSGANVRAARAGEELKRLAAVPQVQIAERLGRFRDGFVQVAPDGAQRWPVFAEKSWKLWLTPVVITPEDLRAITAPVLVIAGDRDLAPLEETLEIYRGVARGQLLILPGTGHDTFHDRAEVVNAALRRFFDAPDGEFKAP
jgi:pimeloyl-ACP methyl ester carboxylesterase